MTKIRQSIREIYGCALMMDLELYKEQIKNEKYEAIRHEISKKITDISR